jgi:hypothetical protein
MQEQDAFHLGPRRIGTHRMGARHARPFAWRRETILDVYNIMLGVVLALAPWLFAYSSAVTRVDSWLTAAAVILVSVMAVIAFSEWEEWLATALGTWLIASPWVLGFTHTHAMYITIAIGFLVAYDALLELWVIHSHYS